MSLDDMEEIPQNRSDGAGSGVDENSTSISISNGLPRTPPPTRHSPQGQQKSSTSIPPPQEVPSPEQSPLRPMSTNPPMTSTPAGRRSSSPTPPYFIPNTSKSLLGSPSRSIPSTIGIDAENLVEPFSKSSISPSSSQSQSTPESQTQSQSIVISNNSNMPSVSQPPLQTASNSNAVTIIQVQPVAPAPRKEENEGASSTVRNVSISNSRPDKKEEPDGLAITRISVGGESSMSSNSNQVVKVTVLTQAHLNGRSEDDGGRGPLRYDAEQIQFGSQALNDSVSEISSVVNNPSVISQLPDRYGFMGGEQFTHESEPDPSPEIIRRREMKWLGMMDKWDYFMRKDFKTVRSRCRKGIPRSVRGRAWYYLTGAAFIKKKDPDLFSKLLEQEGKPECIEDIKKDLHRQFPWHEIFAEEGHGQKDLFKVLKAHSILNAKDGYCQAQAPIAAILLMHMPAEDAFWCLVAICDKYLKGYYSPGMEQLQLDGDILFGLLKRVSPHVYKHMKKQKIDPVLYMTEWFLCAYTRTLPWSSVLRVWDSFLCEGVKVLFRVGLILLKYTLGRSGVLKQCPQMYETLAMLKNLPNYVTHEQFLVVQVQRLDISDDQMRREHYKQTVKRKKAQQKLEATKKQQQKANSASRQVQRVHKSHETAL